MTRAGMETCLGITLSLITGTAILAVLIYLGWRLLS